MPGICGLLNTTHALDGVHDAAERMADTLRHHPWYRQELHVEGPLALARVSLGFTNAGPQPAFNQDRSLLAVMDGEILGEQGPYPADDSQAERLLRGYESEGISYFARLHGSFAAAIWDARARKLVLVNDRFGMKPLHYAQLPDKVLFASEIKALLTEPGLSRRHNPRGLAQFFTYGQLLGEDTFHDAVRLLPAASVLTFEADTGRVSVERYWRPTGTPTAAPEDEHLERIDRAFKAAVDRCTRDTEHLGLSLSGGLDSRAILAVMEGTPVTAVSLGMEGSLDHDCAGRMAELAGARHHKYFLDTRFLDRFEEHMRHMVRLTDGHYLCQCIVMPTLPLYRDLGIRVLLRGHAGELMHMHKAYNFSLDARTLSVCDPAELESWLFRRLQAYMLDGVEGPLFAGPLQAEFPGLARVSLRNCFTESEGVEPAIHRVWHLFLSQRLRRETALSMVEFGSVTETRLPYLDADLIEALLAAPPELKLGERIQEHILRKRRPSFLGVVNANTGTRMGAGPLARKFAGLRLKVLAKLGVKGYQPYERLGLWLRVQLRGLVERLLLSDRCLDRGVFHPDTTRAVVRAHLEGRRNHTFLLLAMMIFELGQREFLDEPEPISEGGMLRAEVG
jgi:asparagine synthase (glutamine-hydrolysing)